MRNKMFSNIIIKKQNKLFYNRTDINMIWEMIIWYKVYLELTLQKKRRSLQSRKRKLLRNLLLNLLQRSLLINRQERPLLNKLLKFMMSIVIYQIKSQWVLNMKKRSDLNDLWGKVLILKKNLQLKLRLKIEKKILKLILQRVKRVRISRILVPRIMFMRIQRKRRKNKDLRDELNHPKHLLEDQRRSKLSQEENLCKGQQPKGRKNLK